MTNLNMMHKLKSTLTTLIFFAALVTVQAQEKVEKTFTGIKSIRLTTASGNGTIKKSTSNQVKVTVEYTYDEDDYTPEFDLSGDRLYIEEDFRRSRWTKGYSEWTLEIPDGLELEFKTGSGNIEVSGINVELNSNTGSGNIEVDRVIGEVRANTGSGNISLRDIDGRTTANTGSGSIRLENIKLKDGARFNTGSGNIRAREVEGELDFNTGSGNIEVEEATITGPSSFNTGSGNARVILASPLSNDLSLNTGSGNATLDFNGQEIEGVFYMKAGDKDDISAPFRFDKEYEEDRGWRGRKNYVKEAKVGSKDIRIRISTGSGRAVVRK
ncbi:MULTISPECIES: DUF4097 family beta strand repeat-containing protein [Roseivirga]|uniref:DUF4097 domain-containing protein n=1 Tax=Roseivirga spongicola TaxID=333140 RepID=A0A150XB05_9BACT|nr:MULTISPECIES: DUF4097 family beta strand repeat-containing protein [Roseivirga]KYG75905.1 hypothetical protein AWW68_08735 [Roseivirga spongicola]MBO6761982.1 DUF4097 family beta strand repeat protein [Roseivirga sp.]MBO6909759.1 DUF4097 family beta strand repeat protein [Roseivirga sp.]WPZ10524.1 DUF4097 family beta strand repeat-containing protein [Roseivirga spongicola]